MTRRRAPRLPQERLADGNRAQRTISAGRVVNAAPVSRAAQAAANALASVAGSDSGQLREIQDFTLASDGPQNLTLNYLPLFRSWNVELNGLKALNDVDYSINNQTLSLLTPLDARTDDVVQIQYDYLSGLQVAPTGEEYALYGHSYFTSTGGAEGGDADRQVSDTVGTGWLRLTNALVSEGGAFAATETFPSGQAISVEWDYATHSGTGADGICMFLSDGTATQPSVIGGGGGTLGYSNSPDMILGIGFDERGNFSSGTGGTGGPGVQADYVVLRGPEPTNNPYLTGASVSPSAIDGHARGAPVHVEVSITAAMVVTVTMDFGAGPVTVINAYNAAAGLGALPSLLRVGMVATTGTQTNVHEIRNFHAVSGTFNLTITGTGVE
jgi:hypothetical protein